MADKASSVFDLVCHKLDSHADAFRKHADLKQLRLKLAEVVYLLPDAEDYTSDQTPIFNEWLMDLSSVAYDLDEIINDWELSEISEPKFDQEVRRIRERFVLLLSQFDELTTFYGEERSAISDSEASSRRSDEYTVFEKELERSYHLISAWLHLNCSVQREDNSVLIVPMVEKDGIGVTVLAKRIYNDEKVEFSFPCRIWVSVGKNFDLPTVAEAIKVRLTELRRALRFLIVLDDVWEEGDKKLEDLRLLVSQLGGGWGSAVLVTTRSSRVAALMGTVSAHHLTYSHSKSGLAPSTRVESPLLEHEDDLGLRQLEYVSMTEIEGQSTSGFDEKPLNSSEQFEMLSDIDVESEFDEDPASVPQYLTDDDMTYHPQTDSLAMPESEIQPTYFETDGLAAHVGGNIATISAGKERMLPIREMENVAGNFQDKGKGQMPPLLNENVKQSIEPAIPMAAIKVDTINVTTAKSIKRNVDKIFRYLNDVRALKIGVHGIGGIGKTTVLKALISYPEVKGMFGVIIFVTVSRYRNTRKIQNEVLSQLSLHGEDYETDSQVAAKLLQVLNGQRFLLVLDDVWKHIDLEAVGIPVPSSENGNKIVMASRESDVCLNMNVTEVIELEALSNKEAWELFSEQVGGMINSPDFQPFARGIVKGCHGLPLLIIVTGKALTGENNVSVWEHASWKFSVASNARVYNTEDVIQLLKFSFDQLKDHDVKSCFLHCGLFPENQELNIFELIEYYIQEGVITGTQADAHNRGHDIVDVLVHASLLQIEGGDSIKMHGLIKDFALGILSSAAGDSQLLRAEGTQILLRAYSSFSDPSNTRNSSSSSSLKSPESSRFFIPRSQQFLLAACSGLKEPPSEEEWDQAKMIFLMDNELSTLPERPSCPNLVILFLQRNCRLRVIPPSFFDLMTSLKVLNLSETRIKSLPKSLVKLKNLQILILRDCKRLVTLPSEVGYLECLEVLDLRGTELNKLPDEIGKLASLRYLEVFLYGSIDDSEYIKLPRNLISSGTISGLHELETLSIFVYPGDERWCEDVKSVVTEVSKLTKLKSLCFHFPELEHVEEFLKESVAWKDQQLTKFNFVVGRDVKSITSRVPDYMEFDYNQQHKCLRIVNGESTSPEVLQILACSTAFYVDHHLGIDSLCDFGVSNINGLKHCIVSECPRIKTVVDIKEHTIAVFPSLENLIIHHLWNLTCIWEGIVPGGSFAELRILLVHTCPKMEYIFTSSIVRCLAKLEELVVEDCPAIQHIILEGEIVDSSCITLLSLKKLRLHYLPRLVNIWRNAWTSLEYISIFDCPQLKKIGLDSKLKDTLMEIRAEKNWWDALEWEDSDLGYHLEDCLTIIYEDDI